MSIGKFVVGKNAMNTVNAGRPSNITQSSVNIRKLTQERNQVPAAALSKRVIKMNSFVPPTTLRGGATTSPCQQWGNRGTERESNFPKVTQPVRGRARYWSRGGLALETTLLTIHTIIVPCKWDCVVLSGKAGRSSREKAAMRKALKNIQR